MINEWKVGEDTEENGSSVTSVTVRYPWADCVKSRQTSEQSILGPRSEPETPGYNQQCYLPGRKARSPTPTPTPLFKVILLVCFYVLVPSPLMFSFLHFFLVPHFLDEQQIKRWLHQKLRVAYAFRYQFWFSVTSRRRHRSLIAASLEYLARHVEPKSLSSLHTALILVRVALAKIFHKKQHRMLT